MIDLLLIGIGTGNPDHLTLEAVKMLKSADLILLPLKGGGKSDLADVRREIISQHVVSPPTQVVEFEMPVRDASTPNYREGVDAWHDAIAEAWQRQIASVLPEGKGRVALLVWGDPSLYDSTLRIAARLEHVLPLSVQVVPGLTSVQLLTSVHRIPLNEIGASVLITTGRQLRDKGWPDGVDTLVVMLDGDCSFTTVEPKGVSIWWAAYLGLPQMRALNGPLETVQDEIVEARRKARAENGWIMDIYILRRR